MEHHMNQWCDLKALSCVSDQQTGIVLLYLRPSAISSKNPCTAETFNSGSFDSLVMFWRLKQVVQKWVYLELDIFWYCLSEIIPVRCYSTHHQVFLSAGLTSCRLCFPSIHRTVMHWKWSRVWGHIYPIQWTYLGNIVTENTIVTTPSLSSLNIICFGCSVAVSEESLDCKSTFPVTSGMYLSGSLCVGHNMCVYSQQGNCCSDK